MSDTDERGEPTLTLQQVRRVRELAQRNKGTHRLHEREVVALCDFWLAAHAAPVSASQERRVAVLKRAEGGAAT
jgi:hypothetical protein